MVNTIILFVILILILWMCVISSRKILITPAFCFTLSFIISIGYALFSNTYIELNMSYKTLLCIGGGVAIFALSCIILKKSVLTYKNKSITNDFLYEVRPLYIDKKFLIVFLILELFIIYKYRKFYMNTTGLSSYADAIYMYRNAVMFTEQKMQSISSYILLLRRICVASGYLFSYVLFHSSIYKYKVPRKLLILNIVLIIYLNTLSGSRGPAITYILTMAVQVYLLYGNMRNWNKVIKFKHILYGIALFMVLIFGFETFGNMMGRNSTKTMTDYLAVYISAPVKNLDSFIREGEFGSHISNNQTFIYVVNWIANRFRIDQLYHNTDQPFRYNSSGRGLGNVYTTFYAFLYDGGIIGLVILTCIMALICQYLFLKSIKKNKNRINICLMMYAYIVPYLGMSFFSNKFYENIFNPLFILYIVIWYIMEFILFRLKFKISR